MKERSDNEAAIIRLLEAILAELRAMNRGTTIGETR